jgi:superfamily II DNA or RNA helicase
MLVNCSRGEYEIVICSYDILKICNERMHAIPWEVVIFDEMHCLKNPESQLTKAVKAIKCRKKLGLTGTLMQNNEKELHCLVDTIAPGVLGSWQEFRIFYGDDIKYGRKKSAVPEALERSRVKEKKLRQKLVPYYLRREKEINPQFQVVKKCDQVVFCDLTPLQRAAYKRILAMPEFELLRRGEEPCDCSRDSKRRRKECCYHTPMDMGIPASEAVIWNRFHVRGQACRSCPNCMGLVCVAQLLKLSNHMELLKVNPRDPPEIQKYATRFATQAFGGDLEVVGGVQQVTTFQETRALGTSTCGKMLVLEKLLALWQKRRQKTLLFSRSTRMLDILQLFLISKAISYSRLDGNTKVEERLDLVNAFNRSDSNVSVFLISTRAGGVGLNLPSATNVVIFDPSWNPAHDCQAQDRAYRIGQTKNVQVYRLITLGTIEEMIYVRQIYKQQLSDTTLKGVKAPRYFEGVQGDRNQQGELFGIRNLLCWKEGGVLKGIQDAYKRDSDGLVLQTNQFQYEKLGIKKRAKKKVANVVEDAEEMVEVADELVADMLSSASSANPVPAAPASSNVEVDGDQMESDDEEFLLPGATTAMHEAIIGEQGNGTDSPLSDSDDAVATEDQVEPENEERAAMELPSASSPPSRDAVAVDASDEEAVKVIAVRPAPHPALVKKRSTMTASAVDAGGSPRPRKGLYVPRYL